MKKEFSLKNNGRVCGHISITKQGDNYRFAIVIDNISTLFVVDENNARAIEEAIRFKEYNYEPIYIDSVHTWYSIIMRFKENHLSFSKIEETQGQENYASKSYSPHISYRHADELANLISDMRG